MATTEDQEELLLCCRYGEIDEVKRHVENFGAASLGDARDENGNTILHMVCGNGHEDLLDYLLSVISPSLLSASNQAGSTPLHWASLNSHLPVVRKLVLFPAGPGMALIDLKNAAGRSPLGEAELAGWEEGAQWLVEKMSLDQENPGHDEEFDPAESELKDRDIELEIQDAEGGVSKMTLGQHEVNQYRKVQEVDDHDP